MIAGWAEVVAAGLCLRGVEEGTSYGRPALRVRGKAFAAEGKAPGHFVLMLESLERVHLLLEMEPDRFFQTPHYAGWPTVLVRYAALPPAELLPLLREAWALRAPKAWRKDGG